ncbi:MAG TPA: serine hydrolase domain-containing protein [Casimicrobiaceae bacterium]|jgi:CubicO group peptidase (beta-lactamase class C family)
MKAIALRGLIVAAVVLGGGMTPAGAQQGHVHHVSAVAGVGHLIDDRLLALTDSGLSGAVIVARGDTVLLAAGYGFANRDKKTPFTANTIAQVGSLTKQFTATAVVDLIRRGRLRASDSLGKIFPDVAANARRLTIDQLLTHTAGLRDDCGNDFDRISRSDLLTRCLAMPLINEPGTRVVYANMGFSVLGAVAEQTSGERLEDYLHDHFFGPLGLRTIAYAYHGVPSDSFAVGYDHGAPQPNIATSIAALGDDYWNLKGNGGIQSTAYDMYRWYRALDSSPLITEDMRKALFTAHAERDPGIFMGYGWFIRVDSTGRTVQISHTGSDGVFFAAWYWRPVERVFVYSVTNFGETDLVTGLTSRIVRIMKASP